MNGEKQRFYLDYAASTPLKPAVKKALLTWIGEDLGNPSSLHFEGQSAKRKIDEAREVISQELGCLFGEIIFTSGGTEAVNTAIFGIATAHILGNRKKILMTAVEHHCVLHTIPRLNLLGYEVQIIPVDEFGIVQLDRFSEMVDERTLLVCCMHCNNELGSFQPLDEIIRLSHEVGAFVFSDAIQSFQIPLEDSHSWNANSVNADLIAISSHKIGGPAGAAALYVKGGVKIDPYIVGGGQEREMRAGTESVVSIIGFGTAVQNPYDNIRRRAIRDQFQQEVLNSLKEVQTAIRGTLTESIYSHPGILHIMCPYPIAESVLIRLDQNGIAAASGAACSSGAIEPSHVLLACGFDSCQARAGLRFSFGDNLSDEDVVESAKRVTTVIHEICDEQCKSNRPMINYSRL